MPTIHCKTCGKPVFGRSHFTVDRALERHLDDCPAMMRGGIRADEDWADWRKRKELFAEEWRKNNMKRRS